MTQKTLSSKEWELISAYLDDELSAQEKARLEERLKTRPEYQEALEGLRRTKYILQKAPVHKVPRNFTLTAADVQPVRTPRWVPLMQWSSAAVALVAVFLFATQLMPGFPGFQKTSGDLLASAPEESAMEMAAPEAAAVAQATPEIIYWGGPPPAYGSAGGLGGGVGGGDGGICSQPGAMCGGGADAPVATQMPFPQPPIPNPLPDLQTPSSAKVAGVPSEPLAGTGPVLGVRPKEQQGNVLPETQMFIPEVSSAAREADSSQALPWIWYAAGGLLVVAAGLFIAGVVARRKISN